MWEPASRGMGIQEVEPWSRAQCVREPKSSQDSWRMWDTHSINSFGLQIEKKQKNIAVSEISSWYILYSVILIFLRIILNISPSINLDDICVGSPKIFSHLSLVVSGHEGGFFLQVLRFQNIVMPNPSSQHDLWTTQSNCTFVVPQNLHSHPFHLAGGRRLMGKYFTTQENKAIFTKDVWGNVFLCNLGKLNF